jgi:NADH-quinone oxidoreductase subunit M
VFLALDLVLFYVFFELTLVGMYFNINGWGHEGRQRAALMFFLYTLFGSLPLLLAILALYFGSSPHTFDMRAIVAAPPLTGAAAGWTFGAMLLTFAVKTPLFPVHTWLPEAHVEAPAPGSVILAGVLLKLGTYGLIRFALQMVPGAFRAAAPAVAGLAILSALYGALVALAQTDLKRMVAYTSVNHMGYVVLAIAAASAATRPGDVTLALDGATLQMVSHGVVTGALFLLVGALQARAHTREMSAFGGLLSRVPGLGWAFVFAAFASLGLPGLAHFPAEFQIFLGVFGVWPWATAAVILGLLVTAGLYLRAIRIAFLGGAPEAAPAMPDLHRREWAAILPLLALALVIGLGPQLVVGLIHGAVEVVRR